MNVRSSRRRSAEIDITPLIDVLFMLIIFFVLTTAFVQGRIEVELPSGHGAAVAGKEPVVVTVTRVGGVLWAGAPVALGALAPRVEQAKAEGRVLLVAADKEASYGAVVALLDRLRELGVADVGLATGGAGVEATGEKYP